MSDISSKLHSKLRDTLAKCCEQQFATDDTLKVCFVGEVLSPYKDRLPNAGNPNQRIDSLISYLNTRKQGTKYVLVAFLEEMSEQQPLGDNYRNDLMELAHELESELNNTNLSAIEETTIEIVEQITAESSPTSNRRPSKTIDELVDDLEREFYQGHWTPAIEWGIEISKDYPECKLAETSLHLAYFNRGNFSKTIGDELDSGNDLAMENYDKAIADYDEAIKLKPNNDIYHNSRGEVFFSKKQYDKAIVPYNRAIELEPNNITYHTNRDASFLAIGDYNAIIENYHHNVKKLKPESAVYYNNLGEAYFYSGNYVSAKKYYRRAISRDSTNGRYWNNLGKTYKAKGDSLAIKGESSSRRCYMKSIENYKLAINFGPKSADFYNNLGEAYFCVEKYNKAIRNYDAAVALDENAIYYNNLSEACFCVDDFDRAIRASDSAINKDSSKASYYSNRGKAHRSKGDLLATDFCSIMQCYSNAIKDYEEAIYLESENIDYRENLALIHKDKLVILQEESNYAIQQAQQIYKGLLKLNPIKARIYNRNLNFLGSDNDDLQ
jgi:tetratricopeptide (TPR) repeat protein